MLRILLSWLLLACLALPTGIKLLHAADGHIQIHCQEDIPNHIHASEFDCEFQKYHFSHVLQAPVTYLPAMVLPGYYNPAPLRKISYTATATRLFSLRAPPV